MRWHDVRSEKEITAALEALAEVQTQYSNLMLNDKTNTVKDVLTWVLDPAAPEPWGRGR